MTSAKQINWNETPENNVLRDCGKVVSRIRNQLGRLQQRELPAEQVRRLIRELHSVKGAAGFLNRGGLVDCLHRLESVLISCLGPDGPTDLGETENLFRELENYLGLEIIGVDNLVVSPRIHHFGESLWWSHELTQSTAVKQGKRAFVLVHGGEQPINETVHRVLQVALVHLVRNAVTHGIEMPEVRRMAGKSEIGLITISAHRQGDGLLVKVADNGAGLDAELDDAVFEMGQSTADNLTPDAGRGVGLATVRALIADAGGQVSVRSAAGEGVIFTMAFPDA